MKNAFILLVSLMAGSASFANPSVPQHTAAQTRVVMTPEHKIKLFVQPLRAKGQLVIWDAAGKPVYSQHVSLQKGLSQQFDFSNLSVGTYRLTLTTGSETLARTFVVQPDPNDSFVVQEL